MGSKFGLALSGGAARGLAHIGVLEGLQELHRLPTCVAGTSIGALVGALFCRTGTAAGLRAQAQAILNSAEFRALGLDRFYQPADTPWQRFKKDLFEKFYYGRLLFRASHLQLETTRRIFNRIFGRLTFRDLKCRFVCNALDIQTGEEIIFNDGLLADAVWASCAIPGIFHPYTDGRRLLIDGGVTNNIPIEPLQQLGRCVVLAVYLGNLPEFKELPDTGLKINLRALTLTRYRLDQRILARADVVITPAVTNYHWADFSRLEELAEIGRQTVLRDRKRIRPVTSPWYRLHRFFRRPKSIMFD